MRMLYEVNCGEAGLQATAAIEGTGRNCDEALLFASLNTAITSKTDELRACELEKLLNETRLTVVTKKKIEKTTISSISVNP